LGELCNCTIRLLHRVTERMMPRKIVLTNVAAMRGIGDGTGKTKPWQAPSMIY
jgi:hypothetical protein